MKKNPIKIGIIIIIVLIIVLAIGLRVGLINYAPNHDTDSELSEMMIEHMNEKYGKDFKASGKVDTGFANNRMNDISLRCYVNGTDELKDYCTVRLNYEDKTYTDNYLCLKLSDEYEDYIKDLVSKYANNYIVHATVENDTYSKGFPDKYDKNAKINDIIHCEEFFSNVHIIIGTQEKDEAEYKKIVNTIYSELVNKKIKGDFGFSFFPIEQMKNLEKDDSTKTKHDYCYYSENKPIYE